MSLTSEMARVTAQIEVAQRDRAAALAKIKADLKRETESNEAAREQAMATHQAAVKSSLRDIFGRTAFMRGAAEEMIERFKTEREAAAGELWPKLTAYADHVRDTVSAEAARLAAARRSMASRERSARQTHVKEIRRRVGSLRAGASKFVDALRQDRAGAGDAWGTHVGKGTR
ncbi:hypothetical protein SAMN02745126_01748 [Enhydrobacter aerosaccus]|uniref:Uncharacterized protein n=1 Tax=Enhydrobacter aerosaccus TaxID=225324 RepID=A0A1T4LW52_9HYPH|nr:hypothetical protein [Enhydrobacter aerosaccus]SJZ58912.1 hypothetical protein SAMN02745126_01748 [Enhydrobacter aerosaccus]